MTKTELSAVFHSDQEIMGGTPVFTGTRVPIQNLFDYLEGGESIDEFLAGFPTVKREQVIGFIEECRMLVAAASRIPVRQVGTFIPGQPQLPPGPGAGGGFR